MDILKFFKSLFKIDLDPGCDGTYHFTDIESEDDMKILISQIELLPTGLGVDKDWIIKSLGTTYFNPKALKQFIETYQKIKVGKDLNYKGEPEKFVEQLKIIYPTIRWDGSKAVGHNSMTGLFQYSSIKSKNRPYI